MTTAKKLPYAAILAASIRCQTMASATARTSAIAGTAIFHARGRREMRSTTVGAAGTYVIASVGAATVPLTTVVSTSVRASPSEAVRVGRVIARVGRASLMSKASET